MNIDEEKLTGCQGYQVPLDNVTRAGDVQGN